MDEIKNFIEVNKINAKIISFKEEVTPEKALALNNLSKSSLARVTPFVDDKMNFFVLIKLVEEETSLSEEIDFVKTLSKKNLGEVSSKEVEKLTGFTKKNFPPLAVFGVKTFFTKRALNKPQLLFVLNEKEFLLIPPTEVIKAQEISDYFL